MSKNDIIIDNIKFDKTSYIYLEDDVINLSFDVAFYVEKNIKNIRVEYGTKFISLVNKGRNHDHIVSSNKIILKDKFRSRIGAYYRYDVKIPIKLPNYISYPVKIENYISIIVDVDWSFFDKKEKLFPNIIYYPKFDNIIEEYEVDDLINDGFVFGNKDEYITLNKYCLLGKIATSLFKNDLIRKSTLNKIKDNYFLVKILSAIYGNKYIKFLFIFVILFFIVLTIWAYNGDRFDDELFVLYGYVVRVSEIFLGLLALIILLPILGYVLRFIITNSVIDINTKSINYALLKKKLVNNNLKLNDIIDRFNYKIKISDDLKYKLKVVLSGYIETYHKETRGSGKDRRTVTVYDVKNYVNLLLFSKYIDSDKSILAKKNNYKYLLPKFSSGGNNIKYELKIILKSNDLPNVSKVIKL